MPLFDRKWSLQIGRTLIRPNESGRELHISFTVEKSSDRQPNSSSVKVYNLGSERRGSLSENSDIELRAGYQDEFGTIFYGQSERIFTEVQDVDVITSIESKDRGDSYRGATVSHSFAQQTPVITVLRYALEQMAIGEGNLSQVESQIQLSDGSTSYQSGIALTGRARDVVNRIITTAGFRWSIQDGVLQVRSGSQPTNTRAIRLAPGRGLIGSPTRETGNQRNRPPKILCRAHLMPSIYPGRVVVLESAEIEGNFSVDRVKYTGSTFGGEWYADLSLEEY
jgi:hypothetical protein